MVISAAGRLFARWAHTELKALAKEGRGFGFELGLAAIGAVLRGGFSPVGLTQN